MTTCRRIRSYLCSPVPSTTFQFIYIHNVGMGQRRKRLRDECDSVSPLRYATLVLALGEYAIAWRSETFHAWRNSQASSFSVSFILLARPAQSAPLVAWPNKINEIREWWQRTRTYSKNWPLSSFIFILLWEGQFRNMCASTLPPVFEREAH